MNKWKLITRTSALLLAGTMITGTALQATAPQMTPGAGILSNVASVVTVPSFGEAALSTKVAWMRFNMGVTHLKKKEYPQAIVDFEASEAGVIALGSKTNIAILYKHLGKCYAEVGDYKKADEAWMKEGKWWKAINYHQDAINAERKAYLVRQDIRLFTVRDASDVTSLATSHVYHGAKAEPEVGTFIGAYAEGDKAVENKETGKSHFVDFPAMTGKPHAGYLYYMNYGWKLDKQVRYAAELKKTDGVMQLAIEPMKGLSEVKDDEYLDYLAETIAKMDIPVFVRFANEMNDPTSKWYEKDPKVYIAKYRMVAKKFREKAPNAVMVWAPLYFPPHNMTWYYPGDDVVDWVGISIYRQYHPELDPLWDKDEPLSGAVDRFKFTDHFKTIYDLYADKKPIFVSECGVSYQHDINGNDITPFATKELADYYTYVPMLYPKMKGLFYFDVNVRNKHTRYQLSTNEALLKVYQEGVKNPYFLGSYKERSPIQYVELPNTTMPPTIQSIFSYVKSYDPDVNSVTYTVGNESTANLTGKAVVTENAFNEPFELKVDFAPYAGMTLPITVRAYNGKGEVIAMEVFEVQVTK